MAHKMKVVAVEIFTLNTQTQFATHKIMFVFVLQEKILHEEAWLLCANCFAERESYTSISFTSSPGMVSIQRQDRGQNVLKGGGGLHVTRLQSDSS